MSVEWDEELARQLFKNLASSLGAWSVDFWTFFQMGRSEHDRADAERTARLEAEAERDALAEKVAAARRMLELRDVGWFESLAAILSDKEG